MFFMFIVNFAAFSVDGAVSLLLKRQARESYRTDIPSPQTYLGLESNDDNFHTWLL